MRPPRYRFPEEVRAATRAMAARMVEEGTVARSPEELEAWIARAPDFSVTLEQGGYGTAFTAGDLYPLLEAALNRMGVPPTEADDALPRSRKGWVGVAVLLVIAGALIVMLMTGAAAIPRG